MMNIPLIFLLLESLKQALRALASNKVRSFLTMLGVIIGIFSVITLVTIGEGAKTYVTDQVQSLGAGYDSFLVLGGTDTSTPPVGKFMYSDVNYLKMRIPEIRDIVATTMAGGELFYGRKKYKASVITGATGNFVELMGAKLLVGRFFTPPEVDARKKVIVLGPKIAKDIFGEMSPLGERVKIQGNKYQIIGIMSPRGSIGPFDMDARVLMPVTTLMNMMGTNKIIRMNIFPKDLERMEEVKEKVRNALERRLGDDDFRFSTQQGLLDIMGNILSAMTGFVSGIAAISLLVGGIGIMNIMLVAVNERVREIGIRKAIGAKKRDILLQFLSESMTISLVGGVLGVAFGLLGAFLVMWAIKGTLVIAWWAIFMATIVSAVVGIFFGVYPAMRAASLDPVEALRYE